MERHRSLSRRAFVMSSGMAAGALLMGCGRLPWQAQAPRMPRIELLGTTNEDGQLGQHEAFVQGLEELGYVEGSVRDERRK